MLFLFMVSIRCLLQNEGFIFRNSSSIYLFIHLFVDMLKLEPLEQCKRQSWEVKMTFNLIW